MPAINAHLAADLIVEGGKWPVFRPSSAKTR